MVIDKITRDELGAVVRGNAVADMAIFYAEQPVFVEFIKMAAVGAMNGDEVTAAIAGAMALYVALTRRECGFSIAYGSAAKLVRQ